MTSESTGKQFMLGTQYDHMPPSEQDQGLPHPPLEVLFPSVGQPVDLPAVQTTGLGEMTLLEAISRRRSLRQYAHTALTLEELAFLLWCTQGVEKVSKRPATLRVVPSAGARHAFETIVLANRVNGLEPGIYQYQAIQHRLARLQAPEDIASRLTEACHQQEMIRSSAAAFFWVAILERMRYRYGERGYRYLHLDAGHVCQNLYLAAEAIDCGACAIAAFDDAALNQELGMDGENQFALYVGTVGKRKAG